MKLSDFVFDFLEKQKIDTVFTLTGGGIMHLVDSLGHSNLTYVCCHHEQAAAIAAQSYDMYKEQLSVCLVTTGPGGTNALTGAAAAYMDSTPIIFMTGQVKTSDFASLRGVRQFGAQENDIISMAAPITKYAVMITKPENIQYELEKCIYYATRDRKGPVWIDIPLDIQAAEIDENKLRHFIPPIHIENPVLSEAAKYTLQLLQIAKRPVMLVGQGAVSSGAYDAIRKFIKTVNIPVLATWRALDFMDSDDEGFFGSPGLQAPRYSNLIIQHADILIVLGSRLDNMITAFSEEHFAYRAKKIIVDIDKNEITKLTMTNVYPVVADVNNFMVEINFLLKDKQWHTEYKVWREHCKAVKQRFPILSEKQDNEEKVNLYAVTTAISRQAKSDDVIVISSTSRCNTAGHIAFNHKRGQKTISSMGMGAMGFALPSVIGAYYGSGQKRVIMIEGDGSFQLNIQELETIYVYHIDVKMFIFDNRGYAAITTMQDRNFGGFYVGSNEKSGVCMPKLEKIATAYDIPYFCIESDDNIIRTITAVMNSKGPVLCEICGSLWFDEIPKCISKIDEKTKKRISALLENPYPYMSEKDMKKITMELLSESI